MMMLVSSANTSRSAAAAAAAAAASTMTRKTLAAMFTPKHHHYVRSSSYSINTFSTTRGSTTARSTTAAAAAAAATSTSLGAPFVSTPTPTTTATTTRAYTNAAFEGAARGYCLTSRTRTSSTTTTTTTMARMKSTTTSGGNNDGDDGSSSSLLFDTHFGKLRLAHSVEPIPYSDDLELTPQNTVHSIGHKKVTIVGCGQVGMATAYAFLNQGQAGTIALIDMNAEKLQGEAKDLEQGSAFHQHVRILASDDYSVSANSHLVIVTAGAAQQPGESRLNLLERNVSIMKNVIPKVLAFSPSAAICIVANPCDIMTAVASKIAGPSVPAGRIFGSGTCLDSSRLRSMLAKRLELDASSVQGYILGEHGDSSVPIWSSVSIGGVPLLASGKDPDDVHDQMHKAVVDSAYDVIERKGSTNWAIGLTSAFIGKAILNDTRNIMPLSTCVRGLYGIKEDVFLSVPCSVGAHGVLQVLDLPMTPLEEKKFVDTAKTIWEIQQTVWDKI